MTAERITVQKCPECGFAPRVSFWHGFDCSQPEVEQVTLLPLELVEPLVRAAEALDAAWKIVPLFSNDDHLLTLGATLDHLLAQAPELKGEKE